MEMRTPQNAGRQRDLIYVIASRRIQLHCEAMESRTEILHRQIDAYRCYLAVGADINIVRIILSEIARHEAELTGIVDGGQRKNGQEHPSPVSRNRA
jgi:hypothetical protein